MLTTSPALMDPGSAPSSCGGQKSAEVNFAPDPIFVIWFGSKEKVRTDLNGSFAERRDPVSVCSMNFNPESAFGLS